MTAAADELETRVREALFDDLNAPQALAAVFDFVHAANADLDRRGTDRTALEQARSALEFIESTLGIVPAAGWTGDRRCSPPGSRSELPGTAGGAGSRGISPRADAIRAELEAKGIAIADSGAGTTWKVAR